MTEMAYAIVHSSGPWKKHKYIKKENGKYYYSKNYNKGRSLSTDQSKMRVGSSMQIPGTKAMAVKQKDGSFLVYDEDGKTYRLPAAAQLNSATLARAKQTGSKGTTEPAKKAEPPRVKQEQQKSPKQQPKQQSEQKKSSSSGGAKPKAQVADEPKQEPAKKSSGGGGKGKSSGGKGSSEKAQKEKEKAEKKEQSKKAKGTPGQSKSKRMGYSDTDTDFDDKNYDEKNRVGDTDFFSFKREDGSTVLLGEDTKWILPKGKELTPKMVSAIQKEISKLQQKGDYTNDDYNNAISKAIDTQSNKKSKGTASQTKSKRVTYSETDSDFDDENYDEKNRIPDTDFYQVKRSDGSTVVLGEDTKWILPKNANPQEAIAAMKKAVDSFEGKDDYTNEEWMDAISSAIDETTKKKKEVKHTMYLMHHGVKGMKWGVRRYQNSDGSLTSAGRARYGEGKAGTSSKKSTTSGKSKGSSGEEREKRGLTDKQKTAIKVGVAVAGTALAVYGGYKVSQYLGAREEEARLAADIIKTVSNAKIMSDTSLYSQNRDSSNPIISKKTTIDALNTGRYLDTQPARRQLEIADTAGASKMSNLDFINAQSKAADNREMDLIKKQSYKSWREANKDAEFWRDAQDLYSRPDFDKIKTRANKQAYKDASREMKAQRKENRRRMKERQNEGAAIDKYYKNLAKETQKENKRALKEYNKARRKNRG